MRQMAFARHAALVSCISAMLALAKPPTESRFITRPMPAAGGTLDYLLEMVQFTSGALKPKDTHAHVNGHLLKIKNPRGHVSAVRPMPDGCGSIQFVDKTMKQYNEETGRSCKFAINAGYFSLHKETLFDCIGNTVTDGKILNTQPMNTTNVNFGILKNGSYVIGYLSPEEVKKGEFQQLVGGLGWIVHKGKNNVEQGWAEAFTGAASTGNAYLTMTTGRQGIGYDKDGGLIILQYDGRTRNPEWGVTIMELADKMIQFGAVEAINLDGGGSTQMWQNGVEIGYSSDVFAYGVMKRQYDPDCPIGIGWNNVSSIQCPRAVSTILCIHDDDVVLQSLRGASFVQDASASPAQDASLTAGFVGGLVGLAVGSIVTFLAVNKMKRKPGDKSMLSSEEESSE